MLKSHKGKVHISGNGEEMLKDLCAAAMGVRDTFAKLNDRDKCSRFLLATIAGALGVKCEFGEGAADA